MKRDGTIGFLEAYSHREYFPKDSNFVSIASGGSHILALKENGTLYNKTFANRDDSGVIYNTPKGNNFVAIAAYGGNSAALTDNEIVYVWGVGYDKAGKYLAKNCVDIVMFDRIIVGLTFNGSVVRYSYSQFL